MRVISGSARGIRLQAPVGIHTRPTSDRAREALFSILQCRYKLCDANVLDICAGTGALGIEALSRGAKSATFVEIDMNALKVIKNNLGASKFIDRVEVLSIDASKALHALAKRACCFNLIFFDPPYSSDLYKTIPEEISKLSLLCHDGLLVIESSAKNVLPEKIANLLKVDSRTYADSSLNFYVLEDV
jgi:16S rRNA (guanine(966)-N(2))-methyltransferase RsmD